MGRVEEKACVVAGAESGIGKAIAERLAEAGRKVVCVAERLSVVSKALCSLCLWVR